MRPPSRLSAASARGLLPPVEPQEGWRTFDHTGDLGLEVWAPAAGRLFELAAVALMRQLAEPRDDLAECSAHLTLEGDDAADLFVHWLNSVLLEAELQRAVWTSAQVFGLSPQAISARLTGPRRDPRRQTFLREVKAVSHHGLTLDLVPGHCRAGMVLDL
jgi:SHS2 domain-containing protein